jgi:hypothetical protein
MELVMYTYVSGLVLALTDESQYEVLDISNTPINILFQQYSQIYLTLANPYLVNNVYVDFTAMKNTLAGYVGTIPQWLINIGNLTLPTVPVLPNSLVNYTTYSDATIAGYKMNVCKIGYQIPINYPVDLLPDLQVSRPNYNTNLGLINTNCIVTVNGFLHQTDYDGTYAYIVQGANTMRKSKINHVGILSFLNIGTVSTLPIDTTKIYSDPSDTIQTLKNKVYLYLDENTTGQTVMLSLGGYLIYPQADVFYQVGPGTYVLHIDQLPIVQRYFESNQYIDLSSLGLDLTNVYPNTINVNQFLSYTVLKLYLSLSQSFWIIVNTPILRYNKIYFEHTKLPGMFIAYDEPTTPLFVGYGRMAEYWKVYEDGQWAISTDNSFQNKYTFETMPLSQQLGNINNSVLPTTESYISKGFSLQIHT